MLSEPIRRLRGLLRRSKDLRAPGTAFSCVTDNHQKFHDQTALWICCLLQYQRVLPTQLFVHLVEPSDRRFAAWLERQQVRIVPVSPFDPRSPHCNKLRQLETDYGADANQVALMDCDTLWLGELPLPRAETVAAKIVDGANPAPDILQRLFIASGLGDPEWTEPDIPHPGPPRLTDRNNCNGGLYILSEGARKSLAEAWPRWARWCMDQRALFGPSIHFDQVSYALAARELGFRTQLLGTHWNYPSHYPEWPLPDLRPQILHYHKRYDAGLSILPIGVTKPDAVITRFNQQMAPILGAYRREFPAV